MSCIHRCSQCVLLSLCAARNHGKVAGGDDLDRTLKKEGGSCKRAFAATIRGQIKPSGVGFMNRMREKTDNWTIMIINRSNN